MINFHPTQQQLIEFAEGNCSPGLALMISAHSDMCSQCQGKIEAMQARLAEIAIDDVAPSDADFGGMLSNILQMPAAEKIKVEREPNFIELDGRKFVLPRALKRYAAKTGNWSHLLGNLYQAPVDLGSVGKANFIFMQKGGRVPEHTHRGNELTLVVNGEFSDGISNYDSGDFIAMDNSKTHAPFSDASEGCLVFSIVDAPLHFTSGAARLLNPFSHLFF